MFLKVIKKLFSFFGLELIPKIPEMPVYNVKNIIDVGVAYGTKPLIENYHDSYFVLIEPNPKFHKYIEQKILNKVKGKLIKFGVGNESMELDLIDSGLISSFYKRDEAWSKMGRSFNLGNKIKVRVKKLDEILEEINFFSNNDTALLKIDTEGFELNVLKGATKILSSSFLKYVMLELRISFIKNNYNPTDIFVYLEKFGFKFLRIDKISHTKKGISFLDVTFKKI